MLAVTNSEGNRVAHYGASGRLTQLNLKRERLITEKKHILVKANQHKALGLDPTILWAELGFKRDKITVLGKVIALQLGSEVARKLIKHEVNVLNVEDLRWVTGARYGSRWNHSAQQSAITHANLRNGVRVRRVNPKNTSQACHKCGNAITHNNKKRTVWCVECKQVFDRDFNAAMNISKAKRYPVSQRQSGDNPSAIAQVVETISHSSYIRNTFSFTRKTT